MDCKAQDISGTRGDLSHSALILATGLSSFSFSVEIIWHMKQNRSLLILLLIAFIITNGFGQTDSADDAKPKDSPSEFKSDYITKQIQAAD